MTLNVVFSLLANLAAPPYHRVVDNFAYGGHAEGPLACDLSTLFSLDVTVVLTRCCVMPLLQGVFLSKCHTAGLKKP
jgi:hypothetical protein